MYTLFSTRALRPCVGLLIAILFCMAIPQTSYAAAPVRPTLSVSDVSGILSGLSAITGGNQVLSTAAQLLGTAQALQSLFGTFSGVAGLGIAGAGVGSTAIGGATEPCVGTVVLPTDTPNCKIIKLGQGAGLGAGISGLGGALSTLNQVVTAVSGVTTLINQFQGLAGGGGGGGGTGTGTGSYTPGNVSASSYDNRFGTSVDDIQQALDNTVSSLDNLRNSGGIDTSNLSELQQSVSELQSSADNLSSDSYQVGSGSSNNTGSADAYGDSLSGQINALLARLNPLSNTDSGTTAEGAPFTIKDISSVTARYVDPDSRIADDEYYQYTVTLNSGEVRTASLPAFASVSENLDILAKSGYRGSVLAFLALAEQQDISYTIDDVKSITVAQLDPLADRQIDDYKEYTITLKEGDQVFTVHTHADMTSSEIESNFRSTGYTGNIDDLINMATNTRSIGDVSFFKRIKYLVFNGIDKILALFTGKQSDNYAELPNGQATSDGSAGTATFYATPTAGAAPLSVTFTVNHPNTTLLFGDGTMQTVSCDIIPESTDSYGLSDITEVVYSDITLPVLSTYHRVYKVKLNDGSVRTIDYYGNQSDAEFAAALTASGYTGNTRDFENKAVKTRGESFAYNTSDGNPNGTCVQPTTVTHTYSEDRTYTAKLFVGTVSNCAAGCNATVQFLPYSELGRIDISVGTDGSSSSQQFTATPAYGDSPLTVTFSTTYGDHLSYRPSATDGSDTLIDFGDDSDRLWVQCDDSNKCRFKTDPAATGTNQHTYAANGVYHARIITAGGMCIGGCPTTELARLTIVVGDQANDANFTANPTSGTAPLSVTFESRYGDTSTYRPSTADGIDTLLYFGDGSDPAWLQCSNTTVASGASCTSGGTLYPAGATLSSVVKDDGSFMSAVDASYVCTNGDWVISGGLGQNLPNSGADNARCSTPISTSHTYRDVGNYTAYVAQVGGLCVAGGCTPQVIASQLIKVDATVVSSTIPNQTNEISFEAKVIGSGDWTTGPITMSNDQELAIRWNAQTYKSCIPYLADSSLYALSRRGETHFLSGNTEDEGFDLKERTGTYSIECGGQENGEEGVDTRTINVTVTGGQSSDSFFDTSSGFIKPYER